MLGHHQQILIAGTPLGCISEVPQGSTPTGFKKPAAQQSRIPGIPGFQNSGNHQRVPKKKKKTALEYWDLVIAKKKGIMNPGIQPGM